MGRDAGASKFGTGVCRFLQFRQTASSKTPAGSSAYTMSFSRSVSGQMPRAVVALPQLQPALPSRVARALTSALHTRGFVECAIGLVPP